MLCIVIVSCGKSAEEKEKFDLVVKEYPSLKPLKGIKARVFTCENPTFGGCTIRELGVFETNEQGIISCDAAIDPDFTEFLLTQEYLETDLHDIWSDVPQYYLARPGWVRVYIHNAHPASAGDVCNLSMSQLDSLHLPGFGSVFLGGIFHKEFQGAMIDTNFLARGAGGVYGQFSASLVEGSVLSDTTWSVFIPVTDTTVVHFEY